MERILRLNLGDWSHDGHYGGSTVLVIVYGDDVSDDALRKGYAATCEETSYDILAIDNSGLTDYRDVGYEDIADAVGCPEMYAREDSPQEDRFIWDRQGNRYSATAMLMWWYGHTLPNFGWDFVRFDTLIGGAGTISDPLIKGGFGSSFGYSLFY